MRINKTVVPIAALAIALGSFPAEAAQRAERRNRGGQSQGQERSRGDAAARPSPPAARAVTIAIHETTGGAVAPRYGATTIAVGRWIAALATATAATTTHRDSFPEGHRPGATTAPAAA